MSEYELMYVVPTSFTEDELGTIESNVAAVLEKNGASILKTKRLGKLKFAYPIKRERFGHYVLVRFRAEPSAIAGIETGLRLSQKEILRHIVVAGEDASETYTLVQFQEVHVEGPDPRRRAPRRERAEGGVEKEQEQKEGVAAIEEGVGTAEKRPENAEKLSEEDLQKKIDEALKEEAK